MLIDHPLSAAGGAFLDIELRPNNSLSPAGLRAVMWVTAIPSVVMSVLFLSFNAWPISALIAIDVAALYWGFRAYGNYARHYERLYLDEESLLLQRGHGENALPVLALEPHWLQVEPLEELPKPALRLSSHGSTHDIGHALPPKERAYLCTRLHDALETRRRSMTAKG